MKKEKGTCTFHA